CLRGGGPAGAPREGAVANHRRGQSQRATGFPGHCVAGQLPNDSERLAAVPPAHWGVLRSSSSQGRRVGWGYRGRRAPPGSRAGPESTSAASGHGRAFRQDRLRIAPEREPGRRGDVMSELPDRPDLDQLRRQARELLRAAADGEPRAITRLRAVSERVTLSAAQLAIAREHGCPSWPALGAEVRRRRMLESAGRQVQGGNVRDRLDAPDAPADRWSFGGGTAIGTSAGLLFPEVLVVGAGHAVLDASLMPAGTGEPAAARARRLLVPGMPLARLVPGRARATRRAAVAALGSLARPGGLTLLDDPGPP